jgi:hypothetical protein
MSNQEQTSSMTVELREKLQLFRGGRIAMGTMQEFITKLIDDEKEKSERRASGLNDGLRRAAEFMHAKGCLPPDTTTVDGIRSYFLNEARFAETLRLNPKEDNLISLCIHCNCMTHTTSGGDCGKCGEPKEEQK